LELGQYDINNSQEVVINDGDDDDDEEITEFLYPLFKKMNIFFASSSSRMFYRLFRVNYTVIIL